VPTSDPERYEFIVAVLFGTFTGALIGWLMCRT
jgi:hypothetical protein